jgi:isopenicillin N synthase-like dioxygenase
MRIPVVDLKPFLYGAPSERLGVARGFGDALETTGFAVIVGHDVPEALASETYATMKAYFALPLVAKLRDSPPEKTKGRGYLPIGIESVAKTLAGETPPDLCEALVFPNPHRHFGGAQGGMIWPREPKEVQPRVEAWTRAIVSLSGSLTRLSALALDLPEDYFEPWHSDPSIALRFVNYPDQVDPPAPGQLRYGAHHDYGGLTILRQDRAPGALEICSADGVWGEAGVVPESFVINVGELLSRWTNGRWRSTLHRVSNPDRSLTGSTARLSMVAFTGPNESSTIAALPSCVGADRPPQFDPVVADAFIRAKLTASMDLSART